MKKIIIVGFVAAIALQLHAQGNNTGMGGQDGDYASLAEKVLK